MSFSTTQAITINGLSVSLTVQASARSLRHLQHTAPNDLATDQLAALFAAAPEAIPKELLRVHAEISRVLLYRSIDILKENVAELMEGREPIS